MQVIKTSRVTLNKSVIPTLFVFTGVWIVGLVIASLQPVRYQVARYGTLSHLILHAIAFAVPIFILQSVINRRTLVWMSASGALLLAIGIELAQRSLYGNRFEWRDLFADILGVAVGMLARPLPRENPVSILL